MKSWILTALLAIALAVLGWKHQVKRNAFDALKVRHKKVQESQAILQKQLAESKKAHIDQAALHAEAKKLHKEQRQLVKQWLEFRGTAAFDGSHTADDYPATLALVRHVSPVPDPTTSNYADCLIEIEIEKYDFGKGTTGEKMIGVVRAFTDRTLTPAAKLNTNDIIHCMLVPAEHIKDEVKKIQLVSTIEDLTLDTHYLAGVSRMGSDDPALVPVTQFTEKPSQAESIAASLAEIDELLARNGGDWETWHANTEPYRAKILHRLTEEGDDITKEDRLTLRSMHHLSHKPSNSWPGPQLAMMLSMKQQLAAWDIDLIVVPIPTKEITVWPHFLEEQPPDDILVPYRLFFIQTLLKQGLEVIDLAPDLKKAWDTHEYVYYDGDDGHPADGGIQVAADATAARLARYEFKPQVDATWRIPLQYRIPTGFDLFPESARTEDRYTATRVLARDLKGVRDDSVPNSPVLLVSDSFGSVPFEYHVRNANFVSHLSARIGIPLMHKQVGAGGPQMLRHMARNGDKLLKNRKVCIFLFSEFYLFQHARGGVKHNWAIEKLPTPPAEQ